MGAAAGGAVGGSFGCVGELVQMGAFKGCFLLESAAIGCAGGVMAGGAAGTVLEAKNAIDSLMTHEHEKWHHRRPQ